MSTILTTFTQVWVEVLLFTTGLTTGTVRGLTVRYGRRRTTKVVGFSLQPRVTTESTWNMIVCLRLVVSLFSPLWSLSRVRVLSRTVFLG